MKYSLYVYSSYIISVILLGYAVLGVLQAKSKLIKKLRVERAINNSN